MKNVIAIVCILGLISCGNESDECNHNTIVLGDHSCDNDLDVTHIDSIGVLLDTLESISSEPECH